MVKTRAIRKQSTDRRTDGHPYLTIAYPNGLRVFLYQPTNNPKSCLKVILGFSSASISPFLQLNHVQEAAKECGGGHPVFFILMPVE